MKKIAIQLENVTFKYQGESSSLCAENEQSLLFIESWQLALGERVFLYGDSGSGKTTLLNLLSGVLLPQSGNVTLFDESINHLPSRQRDLFRAQNIGVVFQQFNLISYLSVLKNIELAAYFTQGKQKDLIQTISTLLEQLQLSSDVLTKKVDQLSVGQQQRVAIARALINKPKLLLVDEPTSALDKSARDAFMHVLMTLCDINQTSLVFVSHDTELRRYFNKPSDKHINIAQLTGQQEHIIKEVN